MSENNLDMRISRKQGLLIAALVRRRLIHLLLHRRAKSPAVTQKIKQLRELEADLAKNFYGGRMAPL